MEINRISLFYLLNHLAKRVLDFFRHWYADGFIRASDWTLSGLEQLDRRFAVRITVKNWFQPLYQDFTVIGYIWGFIFRTIRILVGLSVYSVFILSAIALFALWSAMPLFVIYKIIISLE